MISEISLPKMNLDFMSSMRPLTESLMENLNEPKSNANLQGKILTDEQLSMLIFGRKPGYLCGLGHGLKPTSSATRKRTRSELKREAYEAMKHADLAERSALEARKETATLAEKLKKIEDQQACVSEKLRDEMNTQFAFFHQLLLESYLGQVRGDDGELY